MHIKPQHDGTTGHADGPEYESYIVDRPGKIVLIGHHLSAATQARCLIRSVSLSNAVLDVDPHFDIPKNFYLEILGIRDEIGCTLLARDDNTVTIAFNMLLDPEFLHHVIRLNFETSQ